MLITTSTKDRHKDLHNSFLEPKQSMTQAQNKRKNIQHQIIRNQPIFQTNKHQNNKAVHKRPAKEKQLVASLYQNLLGEPGCTQ